MANNDLPMSMTPHLLDRKFGRIVRKPREVDGMVFGRQLADSVKDTAVDDVRRKLLSGKYYGKGWKRDKIPPLQNRLLPVLALRCAQYLLIRGVREESAFRSTAIINTLGEQFDKGADHNLLTGDVTPFVISSLFKEFLRALPETILTAGLRPHFEIVTQNMSGAGSAASFDGPFTPSQSSIYALAALVNWLPLENRDLLYTVVELINSTGNNHREAKMSSEDLLHIFCPVLKIKPSLLRVLCGYEEIWKTSLNTAGRMMAESIGPEPGDTRANRETIYGQVSYPSLDKSYLPGLAFVDFE